MDIATIRAALGKVIDRIDGLDVDNLRLNPNPPCAMIYPDAPFDVEETLEGDTANWNFTVLLLVPYVDTDDAQDQLDEFLATSGPRSVIAKIRADNTLGDVVGGAVVTELKSYQPMQLQDGGTTYLSAELVVNVWTG